MFEGAGEGKGVRLKGYRVPLGTDLTITLDASRGQRSREDDK